MRLIENKKLGLSYSVEDKIEAGIELLGTEVKALRQKLGSLEGGKAIVRGGEVFLVGIFIPPYQENNTPKSYDPYRTRKLLLNKSEILKIIRLEESKNLTIVPISLYIKNNLVKCEIGLCKKKQKGDKRENIKKDIARRELKNAK